MQPRRGEQRSGDAWLHLELPEGALIALIDGLGHGPAAADAADAAVDFLREEITGGRGFDDLPMLMSGLHRALRGSRGAVAALAHVEPSRARVRYLGVGNTEAYVLGVGHARLMSAFGLLGGGRTPRLRPQIAELVPGDLLILHTDGVGAVRLDEISRGAPCAVIAHLVIERWAREDDDAAVVVARMPGAAR